MGARTYAGRLVVVGIAVALVAGACGNSSTAKPAPSTSPPGGSSGVTEVTGPDLTKNVAVSAQGVTDKEIHVAVITATTNILGGLYGEYTNGIQAYFDYMNSTGGLYGRTFKITANHDDNFFKNEPTVKASLGQDHAFATFIASPVFTGSVDIAASDPPMPTFLWNINPEMAGHDNIFGTIGAICNGCIGQGAPFLAASHHLTKVAILAYGSTASSRDCGTLLRDSFTKYPSAKVVFFDNKVTFAQPDLSAQVTQMKQNGAQLVFTCIDTKEALILAKEIKTQGLNAVQSLPNAYDPQFIADNAQYVEGDFVQTQFVPLEVTPQLPETQTMVTWLQKDNFPLRELDIEGWIAALMFVHGLKLAGPNFSQQKLIDSLNQDTNFTANGMIKPIDWTKQHNDPKGHLELDSKWECATNLVIHSGKFVPDEGPPDKPWVCMVGGGQGTAPTLTKTPDYESFAPAK